MHITPHKIHPNLMLTHCPESETSPPTAMRNLTPKRAAESMPSGSGHCDDSSIIAMSKAMPSRASETDEAQVKPQIREARSLDLPWVEFVFEKIMQEHALLTRRGGLIGPPLSVFTTNGRSKERRRYSGGRSNGLQRLAGLRWRYRGRSKRSPKSGTPPQLPPGPGLAAPSPGGLPQAASVVKLVQVVVRPIIVRELPLLGDMTGPCGDGESGARRHLIYYLRRAKAWLGRPVVVAKRSSLWSPARKCQQEGC